MGGGTYLWPSPFFGIARKKKGEFSLNPTCDMHVKLRGIFKENAGISWNPQIIMCADIMIKTRCHVNKLVGMSQL